MLNTRDRIIETAADLFQKQGYCATGLNDIIRSSESPRGSLYHYFLGGKKEMAASALNKSPDLFRIDLQDAIENEEQVAKGFARFIRDYTAQFEASRFQKGCPIPTVTLETASRNSILQTTTRDIFHNWCQIIIDILVAEDWQNNQACQMAIVMMSSLNGAFVLSRAVQNIEPLEIVASQVEILLKKG